jgi:hypothetical protein
VRFGWHIRKLRIFRGRHEGQKRRADSHHVAGLPVQRRNFAGARTRQLNDSLAGLDLDDRLIDGDRVALANKPANDSRLSQPLAEVGKQERLHRAGH